MKQVQVSLPVDPADRIGGSGWNEALTVQCQDGEVGEIVSLISEKCEVVSIVVTDSPEGAVASDPSVWHDWEG